jgi:tRNA threonylcarbamoyladenosine biosynthesis protein TsaB
VTVLALDSTTPAGSMAIRLDDGAVEVRVGEASRSWSERLPRGLLDLLAAHRLLPADVDLFVVARGPGSLTGLRVGIATIQGLAFATGRPVAAVSALDALAEHARGSVATSDLEDVLLGAWTNAMRREVFTALYVPRASDLPTEDGWEALEAPCVGPPVDAAARWRTLAGRHRLAVAGDVADSLGDVLRQELGPRVHLLERPPLAPLLISIAARRAARGEAGPPHAVRPLYVRKPDAVLAREREGGRPDTARRAAGR